ncbi:glycosyltransferase family 4 protein [Bacillus sp. ISL-47]|uniref:glycosyltransferase family 4 protein n=1 Tax=Bacillus sp. ISL-47 TaxID=2819130 RepID=UPI001BEC9A1B|nr:glycosyltransferase family 4 protein [Bacillus sp. ISL-47]MBT2689218.1 glycosyltransferase family 4 protein [Bacillus sp. ISL-47]MBT2708661.1 glycosyltransferase family 4 protein [Pseudomonas sp. ISL-84]
MKIVVLSHYFPPEIGAPSARIYEMAKHWVDLGNEVHIVTCFPNHPTGIIPEEYQGKKYMHELMNGIHVHRNYVYATPNKGFIKKTLGHISFMFSSVLISMRKIQKPDVIITSSPTFFSIFSGYWFSLRKRAPFILEIRDLWPAAMIELGVMKKGIVTNILEKMELYFYRKSKKLIMVTKSFKENVVSRGIDAKKVHVITNGVNQEMFYPKEKNKAILKKYKLENKFVISYVGAHGISQNLGVILKVAKALEKEKDIHFLFVGEGAEKDKLKNIVSEQDISNVTFIDSQPKEMIPEFYNTSDISLIPLKNIELFKTFIPSKMFEIMACGVPIVASLEGEAADILNESQAAEVVKPDNSEEIIQAIIKIKNDKVLNKKLQDNGPAFVEKNYSRKKLAEEYLRIISEA